MSDLAEIRRELTALREIAARVQQDVAWIKDGMEDHREVTGKHDERIQSVERRQWWLSGVAAAIGALLGYGGGHGLKL